MFIDQLDERVNKCNNAYHRAMKMKPIDANQSIYSDFNKESEEEIVGTFCKKEFEKSNQKEFRVEKAIKRKDDKLYVKWKEYHNSFNSCRDKKKT